MVELDELVSDFAEALERADRRGPKAVSSRTGRSYRPGIGPHTEAQTTKLVTSELSRLKDVYWTYGLDVPYSATSRQRCDWCLGSPPNWEWAIEVKMLRLFGDNGKLNDNMLMHILSPYVAHRSAVTDCHKLVTSDLSGQKAIVIFGYDYDQWPMDPAIEAFEMLAGTFAALGERHLSAFDHLVHPIHQRGRVFGWEITG